MLSGTLITCAGFLPLALAQGMVAEFTNLYPLLSLWHSSYLGSASVLISPVLGYKIVKTRLPKPESEWTKRDRIVTSSM